MNPRPKNKIYLNFTPGIGLPAMPSPPQTQENHKQTPLFTFDSLLANGLLCSGVIGGYFVYRRFIRRVPTAQQLPASKFKRQTMLGKVVSVGDADNFRFFHTPGGFLCGWGWLRPVPKTNTRKITSETIMVRLCGIDAPELAHFGKPAQRYGKEALAWLRGYVLGRRVRIVPLARDQYGRIVAEARVWKLNGLRNVSLEMLRAGWAVVYESKAGAEFNGMEQKFRKAEASARRWRRGMFASNQALETPGEFKKRFREL